MTREYAVELFNSEIKNFKRLDYSPKEAVQEYIDAMEMAIKALEKEKADETTDHPEWINYEDGLWKYAKCPVCGSVRNTKTPFCPICGTKMKGVIGK